MNYKQNPFYILGASPEDSRRKIVALAEEKSLLGNADACTEARNILTNPQRRIAAEVGWFLDCSTEETDDIKSYIQACDSLDDSEPLPVAGLSAMSQLNVCIACLENATSCEETSFLHAAREISRLFEQLDAKDVLNIINKRRLISGFPQVERTQEIEEIIAQLRHEIRQTLTQKILQIIPHLYPFVAFDLANDFARSDRYRGHTVLEDIISEFDLATSEERDGRAAAVRLHIDEALHTASAGEPLNLYVMEPFEEALIEWHTYAAPLHIAATFKGTHVRESEDLFFALRNMTLEICNKYDRKNFCEFILHCMKEAFEDIPYCREILENDTKRISELIEQDVKKRLHQEKIKEILLENVPLDGREFSVTLPKNEFYIPKYCMCCMQPTQNTIAIEDVKMPLCKACEEKQWDVKGDRYRKNQIYNCFAENKAKKLVWILWAVAAIVGIGLMVLIYSWIESMFPTLLISAVLAIILLVFLTKLEISHPTLGYDSMDDPKYPHFCSFRLLPSNGLEFRCMNGAYAKAFALENDASVTVCSSVAKTHLKDRDVKHPAKDLYPRMDILYKALAGLLIVAAIFLGSVLPKKTSTSKPSNSSSSYTDSSYTPSVQKPIEAAKPLAPKQEIPRPEPIEAPKPISGHVFYSRYADKPCAFKIDNNSGSSYFMKFVNPYSGETVISFFVRGFSEVSIDMPTGTYELRYATGNTWYGEGVLFGDSTRYAKDEELYPFTSDGYSSTIWSVTFNAPSSSDMDTMYTETIDASEF